MKLGAMSLLVSGALALTACAPAMQKMSPLSPDAVQTAHHIQVRLMDRWKMAGRLKLYYRDRKWQFGIRWQCEPERYEFGLHDVSGRKIVQIKGTPEAAELKDNKGNVKRAADSRALLSELFGVEVPSLLNFCNWLAGLPLKDGLIDAYRLDAAGRLEQLAQSGWRIEYKNYAAYQAGSLRLDLPQEILFEKDEVRIAVSITAWTPRLAQGSTVPFGQRVASGDR